MRFPNLCIFIAFASWLSGCDTVDDSQVNWADSIENAVILPDRAFALAQYERYYSKRDDGSILAVYIIHPEGHRKALALFCRENDEKHFPCPANGGDVRLVRPGERTWVEDPLDLPAMDDGGCGQITIEYLPVERNFCGWNVTDFINAA